MNRSSVYKERATSSGGTEMREAPKYQISQKALKVWKLSAIIQSLIFLAVSGGIAFAVYYFEWPIWIAIAVLGAWLIFSIIFIFITPKIQHRTWRYEVHENEIDIQSGLFVVKRVLVPMVRVQHVNTKQGPLLRKNDLATVTIHTAATIHEIPALDVIEADQLRDFISKLARVTEDDV